MTNPRVQKEIKEIDRQIAKLQAQKAQMLSWRESYEAFHLKRIEDILFRGTVKTQMNRDTTNNLHLDTTREKLDFIITSLFEMGIIEDYEVEQKIQKGLSNFFSSE